MLLRSKQLKYLGLCTLCWLPVFVFSLSPASYGISELTDSTIFKKPNTSLFCDTIFTNIDTSTCRGTLLQIAGVDLEPNSSAVFFFTTQAGCDSVVTVTVLELLPVEAFLDTVACAGSTLNIGGIELQANSSATIFLVAQNGCDSILTVTVLEQQPVTVNLDSNFCVGQTIMFNNQAFMPIADTVLTAIYTGANGCDSIVHLHLIQRFLPAGEVVLQACPGTTAAYNGIDILAGDTQTVQLPGLGVGGCDSTVLVRVDILSPPVIQLAAIDSIGPGDSIQLKPTVSGISPLTWQWTPPEWLSCTDCPNPVARPETNQVFTVQITDANGCTATDAIALFVNTACDIYIPNAFSPDDNGENDWFTVFGPRCIRRIVYLRIYDRWGELVFERRDFQPNHEPSGWDGRFRNRDLPPNVFVYVTAVELVSGVVKKVSGDVTLIR